MKNRSQKFDSVEVFRDPRDALDCWRVLSPERCGSFYQSEAFLLSWLEVFGAAVEPFFIVARSAGVPVALLPLGVRRVGPLRVAEFWGGKHANYNLGLFRDPDAFAAEDVAALLRAGGRTPGGPHLYRLVALPRSWNGVENPLTRLPNRPGASPAYCTALAGDGEVFLAQKLSADTRKKLRKKEKRLTDRGALSYFRAPPEQADAVLDVYFAHKRRNYAAGSAAETAFYRRLAGQGLELHVLALDERPIAILGVGLNGARLQGLFIAYDPDPEIAKSSPGDLLLTRVLRDARARGLTCFDLGLGEARYKAMFCGEREAMADVVFAATWLGALTAPVFWAQLQAKAAIKSNARVWGAVQRLRRAVSRARNLA
ncbi:CelD/BcsL family acetyltransferase involved in cellulose biosynthesis [Rhodoblastus acidophilus]|uniref:GNAT family N-acetyltransferase n=1 Tax=Rhodoblastus acidophilus TaxID=1074 RepID=UPI002224EE8C|nr:GNAT family N-acetyltransferase [Rhodoblastus acidophilus]MCW2285700.1 CelD/BcsL family acetyltransferase involved in cellulose biosynthesis [Rhodoblastus acidophilus]MCW2333072.1 CelD/BcsL family acetyltransferase involved in cellulose biosynthesis [Rhodoblastus acidophilus]